MSKIQNIESALSSFIIEATSQVAATEIGDSKASNKAFNQIIQIVKYLKDNDKLIELEAFLNHNNVGVRMFAAYALLQINSKRAVAILSAIAEQNDIHSLTASTTLDQWNKDNLKFPF